MNTKKLLLFSFVMFWCVATALCLAAQALAAITVRVQPSGPDVNTAYVLTGEERTYFGNAEGSTSGSYEYMWDFSDGDSTAWATAGDPNYITVNHTFTGSGGGRYARLTVRDPSDTSDSASALTELYVKSADDFARQKNSAIDRGLRRIYQDAQYASNGIYWYTYYPVAETAMALIAMENHRHNLEAPDSDIYKRLVQGGIRYLFNNAQIVDLSDQACIGDPEADDGDSDNDDIGIAFIGNNSEGYESPLAMLSIINSCSNYPPEENAKIFTVSEGALAGETYWDVMVDAKDFLAYAQTDFSGTGSGGGRGNSCYNNDSTEYFYMYTYDGSLYDFYVLSYIGDCSTLFMIDWGDGTVESSGPTYCESGYTYWYVTSAHTYDPGDYTATGYTSYDNGDTWNAVCSMDITVEETSDDCSMAGWRYSRNYDTIDNSVSQWPTLALYEAWDKWGININPQAIELFKGWLAYSQDSSGGFGYTAPWDWVNFPKTAAGLAMLKWAGFGPGDLDADGDAPVDQALSYLDTNWDLTCYDGNLGEFYSMYAFYKGMKYQGLNEIGGRDWEYLYDEYLINDQDSNDYFWGCNSWIPSPGMTTSIAIAILAPAVAGLPPVAEAGGPYGPILAGQTVTLDGSGSTHQDPTKDLVLYEWDFDASDGLWWTSKAVPDTGEGATGIYVDTSYADTGSDEVYTVTLRVTDNSSPVQRDTDTSTVTVTTGNVPPVAVTNGPWYGYPGWTLTFDGTASYDPNECTDPTDPSCLGDSIVSYEWDIDGDGTFNKGNGDDGTPVTPGDYSVVTKLFPLPTSGAATLRVTDSYGLTDSATEQIIAVAITYATDYEWCFREAYNRYEYRMGIIVEFQNIGTSDAENVVARLTSIPTNMTILNGTSSLGDMEAGEAKTTACDATTKTADIEVRFNRRVVPTGDWSWTIEFDFDGQHYIIPNIPALAP